MSLSCSLILSYMGSFTLAAVNITTSTRNPVNQASPSLIAYFGCTRSDGSMVCDLKTAYTSMPWFRNLQLWITTTFSQFVYVCLCLWQMIWTSWKCMVKKNNLGWSSHHTHLKWVCYIWHTYLSTLWKWMIVTERSIASSNTCSLNLPGKPG